jgi:hypothetical protein
MSAGDPSLQGETEKHIREHVERQRAGRSASWIPEGVLGARDGAFVPLGAVIWGGRDEIRTGVPASRVEHALEQSQRSQVHDRVSGKESIADCELSIYDSGLPGGDDVEGSAPP